MNTTRILLGGLAAGFVCFFGDGIVHGAILGEEWKQAMTALGKMPTSEEEGMSSMLGFAVYDFMKGFFGVWLYAAIRPRFGAGPKTAIFAGIAAWVALGLIPHVTWLVIPVFEKSFVTKWIVFEAFPILAGTFVGAWIYRE